MNKVESIAENRSKTATDAKKQAGVYTHIPKGEKCSTGDFRTVLSEVHRKGIKDDTETKDCNSNSGNSISDSGGRDRNEPDNISFDALYNAFCRDAWRS